MSAEAAPPDHDQPESKKITFKFCAECSNLLYPREDKESSQLMYACRTCSYSEEASTSCIYRNDLISAVGETAGITQDIGTDPTLPRIQKSCPRCSEMEAVYFQSQQRTAETGMKLYFVCCACGNVWQDPDKDESR